nr:exonuclease domain-containing protein [uncultured Haemophilus sp.]
MSKYVIVDIETANADITNVCQIAIVTYENGEVVDKWETLVNPECEFHPINVSIHGIDAYSVKNAPKWCDILPIVKDKFADNLICSYGVFDRLSLTRLYPYFTNQWLDIIRIVRRAWGDQFSKAGYGLANVAYTLGIKLDNHHDALCDVLTAGEILKQAIATSGQDLEYWLERIKKPINLKTYQKTVRNLEGNSEGILYGETIVFTGELSLPRAKAAEMAAQAGCNVATSVTKKVTMLVLGVQDEYKLKGKALSSKEEKALALIEKGQKIQLLTETDFIKLIEN